MNIEYKYQLMVFKNEYEGKPIYKIGLSKKNADGSYANGYILAQFKKGIELENRTNIYIKNAWLTFYLTKDKKTVPYIFINEFETVEQTINRVKEENKDPFQEMHDNIEETIENDLPW